MMRWLLSLWMLGAALAPASAHMMAEGQGAVRIVGNAAYAVISVPVAALRGVDDDSDGLLSAQEIDAHRSGISLQLSRRLQFTSRGAPGTLAFEDVLLPHSHTGAAQASSHIVVMRHYQWNEPVQDLALAADIFDSHATAGQKLLVRAIDGGRSEAALLTARHSSYRYFDGPWRSFASFVCSGAEHILSGPDHLLFLLTILVVGAGWRYWLSVVSSFTLAHSITLLASALGYVQAPSAVVEPLIAASIVLLALDNLWRRGSALRQRAALVFGCGLLHGLGIAAVLGEGGVPPANLASSLLGFNLGVELGQLAFVAVALATLGVLRLSFHPNCHARIERAGSLLAAAVGTVWLLQRAL